MNTPKVRDINLIVTGNILISSLLEKVLIVSTRARANGCEDPALGVPLATINLVEAQFTEVNIKYLGLCDPTGHFVSMAAGSHLYHCIIGNESN